MEINHAGKTQNFVRLVHMLSYINPVLFPQILYLIIDFNIMLPSKPNLSCGLFISGFYQNPSFIFLYPVRATYHVHLVFNILTQTTFGENYK
jgi:hypothetical protein